MKVVLLAGGFGSRISEESAFRPKPMIEEKMQRSLHIIMPMAGGDRKSTRNSVKIRKKSKFSRICLHMWDFFCNFVR